jgi:hypothetical protein
VVSSVLEPYPDDLLWFRSRLQESFGFGPGSGAKSGTAPQSIFISFVAKKVKFFCRFNVLIEAAKESCHLILIFLIFLTCSGSVSAKA